MTLSSGLLFVIVLLLHFVRQWMSVCVTSNEFHYSLLYGTHKTFKTKHIRIFLLYANKSILKQQHLLSLLWLLPRSCCNNCEAMLNPKLYKPSAINIKMSLIPFCFWAGCAVLGSTENSAILLKYPTFEGVFFILAWARKWKHLSLSTLHCTAKCIQERSTEKEDRRKLTPNVRTASFSK